MFSHNINKIEKYAQQMSLGKFLSNNNLLFMLLATAEESSIYIKTSWTRLKQEIRKNITIQHPIL